MVCYYVDGFGEGLDWLLRVGLVSGLFYSLAE